MLIKEIFPHLPHKPGDVGIEIEVEGKNIHSCLGWDRVNEGSLRGKEAIEYRLPEPVPYNEVYDVLKDLYDKMIRKETILFNSDRTSVHVHINVMDMNVVHCFNFIFLYIIFEDILLKYSGEEREGNLFCLSTKDAEGLLFTLKRVAETQQFSKLNGEDIRYSSLNLQAIPTYGSLEFRSLRGTGDFGVMSEWIYIIKKLKDFAEHIETPRNLLYNFSADGPEKFFYNVFGREFEHLKYKGWEIDSEENIRNIQFIISSTMWETFTRMLEPLEDI